MTARRGYTLIELLTVVACHAVLLTLAAALLTAVLQIDRRSRQATEVAASRDRLDAVLRHDLHRATAPPQASNDGLSLSFGTPLAIVYQLRDGHVERVESTTPSELREAYAIPKGELRWGATSVANAVVEVTLARSDTTAAPWLRVLAAPAAAKSEAAP